MIALGGIGQDAGIGLDEQAVVIKHKPIHLAKHPKYPGSVAREHADVALLLLELQYSNSIIGVDV